MDPEAGLFWAVGTWTFALDFQFIAVFPFKLLGVRIIRSHLPTFTEKEGGELRRRLSCVFMKMSWSFMCLWSCLGTRLTSDRDASGGV